MMDIVVPLIRRFVPAKCARLECPALAGIERPLVLDERCRAPRAYATLMRGHEQRIETARSWLLRHYPDDVVRHMERMVPHTSLWFSIVDRVEPRLGAIARLSIQHYESEEVCSSCGDPASDYRLVNAAEAMPGIPSLCLCSDCVAIRRGFGEQFEAFD